MDFFQDHENIEVAVVITNNPSAGVVERAGKAGVPCELVPNAKVKDDLLNALRKFKVDVIALAGFLRMIPEDVISAFEGNMLNIHPSLLPKFGGKGMYGMNVHRAVKEANENESGITIHLVNAEYDKGKKLFQARVKLDGSESPEEIAQKVLALEHKYYPRIIEAVCLQELV